jgi:hypothetical protein
MPNRHPIGWAPDQLYNRIQDKRVISDGTSVTKSFLSFGANTQRKFAAVVTLPRGIAFPFTLASNVKLNVDADHHSFKRKVSTLTLILSGSDGLRLLLLSV